MQRIPLECKKEEAWHHKVLDNGSEKETKIQSNTDMQ